MPYYLSDVNYSTFLKTALVVSIAVVSLTGCDHAPHTADTKPTAAAASAVTPATVKPTSASSLPASTLVLATTPAINAVIIDPKSFAGHETAGAMAVAMSAFVSRNVNESSDLLKLPLDKKGCLFNSNHATSLPVFDDYLAKKLSVNELKKTNAFYASEVGQKLTSVSDRKIKQLAGLNVPEPLPLSEADTASLKAFASTPEGKKLMALFSPANQLEMQRDVIEPMMTRELAICNIQPASGN